jgi:hypothetical protein
MHGQPNINIYKKLLVSQSSMLIYVTQECLLNTFRQKYTVMPASSEPTC